MAPVATSLSGVKNFAYFMTFDDVLQFFSRVSLGTLIFWRAFEMFRVVCVVLIDVTFCMFPELVMT